ncbi:hypothetical protein HYC85_006916 [Camellia sinensis]|uniref:4Fe-4S ferredoxin-type domain-containing protein n=1 Tax=Camellia sinensis TaxID=4442 RepID=A0A7J7HMI7_CAMSI|nr:hypothetical protein HYC85_006916 [Camellia sinensis]
MKAEATFVANKTRTETSHLEMEKVEYGDGDGDVDGYDAIVVGSGYGGSVAACRMSMAGIKVCLIEKGRRWEAQDFPTDSFKIMSAARIENRNLGISFGPKDALFQLYEQDDSLAAMACGLGGGSLMNAGVMLPTPIRARRNPKWPKEWERDWEACQASASSMLRIQSVPVKFANTKIMEEVAGEEFEETSRGPLKLSVNFEIEEQASNTMKSQEMGTCLACGNCLAGCPYNAKNSTDKTYLVSAVQISMMILGKNKILPLFKSPSSSPRHRLLKFIARLIPSSERCTCDECEVFSGIFGNTFWHDNISPAMHYQLKHTLPRLPMAAFPHLRRICNVGFIVGPNGENSYVTHPERMTISSLYVSGGRTLLVTPKTSFLAHKYMKLHQPGFRHERVVVEGFGHSDLLIGEEAYLKVFPHILEHIRLAEEGRDCVVVGGVRNNNKYDKEVLEWGDDPFVEENGGFWSCVSPMVTIWLLLLFLVVVVYILL